MTTAKFDISEIERAAEHVKLAINKVALRALNASAMRVVQNITTVVIPAEPRPPIDRRLYAAGWRHKPAHDGAFIQNSVPWATIVEHGARAENIKIGRAMIDALAEWAIRKGIASREDARSVAWAVATAMKKKGIFDEGKGLKILEKALKGLSRIYAEELKRELEREFR